MTNSPVVDEEIPVSSSGLIVTVAFPTLFAVTIIFSSALPSSIKTDEILTETFWLCDILNFPVNPVAVIVILYDSPTVTESLPDVMLKLAASALVLITNKIITIAIIILIATFVFFLLIFYFPFVEFFIFLFYLSPLCNFLL